MHTNFTRIIAIILTLSAIVIFGFTSCGKKVEDVIGYYQDKMTSGWFNNDEFGSFVTTGNKTETAGLVKDVAYYVLTDKSNEKTLRLFAEKGKVFAVFEGSNGVPDAYDLTFADVESVKAYILRQRTDAVSIIDGVLKDAKWEKVNNADSVIHSDAECDLFSGVVNNLTCKFSGEYYEENGQKRLESVMTVVDNLAQEITGLTHVTEGSYKYPETIKRVTQKEFSELIANYAKSFKLETFDGLNPVSD